MANVTITHTWGEHESVSVDVYVEGDYPDAVDEARANASRAMAETLKAFEVESGADE